MNKGAASAIKNPLSKCDHLAPLKSQQECIRCMHAHKRRCCVAPCRLSGHSASAKVSVFKPKVRSRCPIISHGYMQSFLRSALLPFLARNRASASKSFPLHHGLASHKQIAEHIMKLYLNPEQQLIKRSPTTSKQMQCIPIRP